MASDGGSEGYDSGELVPGRSCQGCTLCCKLLQVEPVMKGTVELGWPTSAVVPLGVLLLLGAVLYAIPRTAVLGAIYLTGFLGGAIATHYRIGSPLFTHVLFGVYVAAIMWAGLALRSRALREALAPQPHGQR